MVDEAIFTLRKQWTTSTALAGRVLLSTAADKVTVDLPKLKWTPLGGPIGHTDDGPMTLVKTRVQLDVFTKSVVEGRAIFTAIRNAAHAYPGGTLQGVRIVRAYFDEQPAVSAAGVVAEESNVMVVRVQADLLIDYREI